MATLKNLRATAKQFGLNVSGRKAELESRISEFIERQQEYVKRISRAERSDKYKALRGLINDDNRFKNEFIRINDEVDASLRIEKLTKDPNFINLQSKGAKRIKRRSITKIINKEGQQILQDLNDTIEKQLEENGVRVKIWKLTNNLNKSTTARFMSKIETLQTAFYLRFYCTYQLRNIETDEFMPFHKNFGSPSLFFNFASAHDWLDNKDEERLSFEKIERPSTKWTFVKWIEVRVKAILTNQVLLGAGKLPDWLRQQKGLYALDTYDDNLCVLRCLAVHQGARPNRCTKEAIRLGKELFGDVYGDDFKEWPKISLENTLEKKVKTIDLTDVEEKFKIGITVYEVTEEKRTFSFDKISREL